MKPITINFSNFSINGLAVLRNDGDSVTIDVTGNSEKDDSEVYLKASLIIKGYSIKISKAIMKFLKENNFSLYSLKSALANELDTNITQYNFIKRYTDKNIAYECENRIDIPLRLIDRDGNSRRALFKCIMIPPREILKLSNVQELVDEAPKLLPEKYLDIPARCAEVLDEPMEIRIENYDNMLEYSILNDAFNRKFSLVELMMDKYNLSFLKSERGAYFFTCEFKHRLMKTTLLLEVFPDESGIIITPQDTEYSRVQCTVAFSKYDVKAPLVDVEYALNDLFSSANDLHYYIHRLGIQQQIEPNVYSVGDFHVNSEYTASGELTITDAVTHLNNILIILCIDTDSIKKIK